MARLSHDEFLTSLSSLLTDTTQKTGGSVYLTQKPLLHDISTSTSTPQPQSQSVSQSEPNNQSLPPILIRATDGKTNNPNPNASADSKSKPTDRKNKPQQPKLKLSTVVDQADLEAFYTRYAEVCKGGMTGLKKRDRKKGKAKKGGGGKVGKS